jgi:hypothetical protein
MPCQLDFYLQRMRRSVDGCQHLHGFTHRFQPSKRSAAPTTRRRQIECIVVDSIHYDLVDTYAHHHRKRAVAHPCPLTGI